MEPKNTTPQCNETADSAEVSGTTTYRAVEEDVSVEEVVYIQGIPLILLTAGLVIAVFVVSLYVANLIICIEYT